MSATLRFRPANESPQSTKALTAARMRRKLVGSYRTSELGTMLSERPSGNNTFWIGMGL
jgi:hypothetical protein